MLDLLGVLRVSTPAQADGRYGLPAQEANVRRWVEDHGHRLVDLVPEAVTGEAGTDPIHGVQLDQRPELADVLGRVESGEVDGLVIPASAGWANAACGSSTPRLGCVRRST